MSVVEEGEFVWPDGAVPGDVLVLTKPLCTQSACNMHQWMDKSHRGMSGSTDYVSLKEYVSDEEIKELYDRATKSMTHLNFQGARLMKKHGGHCATDITGFGLIKHCQNLCANQKSKVDFVIETIPVFKNLPKMTEAIGDPYQLFKGQSAQSSGGLLIALPKDKVDDFIKEMKKDDNLEVTIFGKVVEGEKKAYLSKDVKFVELEF